MLESILYVEDEEITAQMIGEILNDYCENLYFAPNGKIGQEIFKKKKLDLIITDIQMPIMNGIEMIQKIREEDKDIVIVCTTGSCEIELQKSLSNLNVHANIKKPININTLIDFVKSMEV